MKDEKDISLKTVSTPCWLPAHNSCITMNVVNFRTEYLLREADGSLDRLELLPYIQMATEAISDFKPYVENAPIDSTSNGLKIISPYIGVYFK